MKIIGITGNIGSGKSTVSKILSEDFNACIIDADIVNHNILKFNKDAYNEIVQCFGNDILAGDLQIDRKKLGAIVFEDKEALNRLVGISHKYIVAEIRKQILDAQKSGRYGLIVVDAPLLVESGLYNDVDSVWLVYAPVKMRAKRITARDNMLASDVYKRISGQTSFDELVPYADVIIENDGDFNRLREKIYNIIEDFADAKSLN